MSDRRIEYKLEVSFGFKDTKQIVEGSINFRPEDMEHIGTRVQKAINSSFKGFKELAPDFFESTFDEDFQQEVEELAKQLDCTCARCQ